MRKDIKIPEVKNVFVAIVKEGTDDWKVYIINNNHIEIRDTLIVSHGYGKRNGEKVKTATLRHFIGNIKSRSNAPVERIDPALFDLNHEFWITFYIKENIYDKKFVFNADSLSEKNLSYINELNVEGIIHSL